MAHCLLHNTRNMVHQEHSVDSKLRCSTVKFCTKYTDTSISKQVGWKGKKTDKMYFQENVFLGLEYNSLSLFVLYRHLFVVVCLLKNILKSSSYLETNQTRGYLREKFILGSSGSIKNHSCQCRHVNVNVNTKIF